MERRRVEGRTHWPSHRTLNASSCCHNNRDWTVKAAAEEDMITIRDLKKKRLNHEESSFIQSPLDLVKSTSKLKHKILVFVTFLPQIDMI